MQNLRDKEINLLSKMLSLTSSTNAAINAFEFNDQWKVLIYDKDCRDIISPLMSVMALQKKGVTLHLMIHTEREPVPDAPAVYFVRPTEENIKRIAADCAKHLYRTVYLNFVTRIERSLMEKLAQELVATNSVSMVAKIYDQYLDVIALEPNLFTLNIKDSFMLYNEASLSEASIRKFMNRVGTGLLSMVRVLGSLPVIRSPSGGAAEMLAHEVCSLLRENTSVKGPAQNLFEDCLVNDRSRPLLLVFDRAVDMFPVLQHNGSYQALITDLLDAKLNKVTIDIPDKDGSKSTKKTFDLNTQTDTFFAQYASVLFPDVVDANTKELAEVVRHEAAVRSSRDSGAQVAGGGLDAALSSTEAKGREMGDTLQLVKSVLDKKKALDAHTSILKSLMKLIVDREQNTYYDQEQAILAAGGRPDRVAILALLRDGAKGNLQDKARLLTLVAATNDPSQNSKANNEELDAAFSAGSLALSPPASQETVDRALAGVAFLRRLQSLSSPMSGMGGGGQQSGAILSSFLNNATQVIGRASQMFAGKFVPYYVTRVVDNLAEGRACSEANTFTYFDPRAAKDTGMPDTAAGHKYSDVIVFLVGGGSYAEFYNLQELLKGKSSASGNALRSIMYGCSDLVSGGDFLDQLERLGAPNTVALAK